jgi:L-malate glycosyltransferase
MHVDRCQALAEYLAGESNVVGVEMGGISDIYAWSSVGEVAFHKITLYPSCSLGEISLLRRCYSLLKACISQRKADYFFCHYEKP